MTTYAKISVTAKLAAYMRRFSDIPFAEDVAEVLQAREAFDALLAGSGLQPDDLLWYAPIFEVRYKSIAAAIRASRVRQVVEMASGVSLRGLAMAQDPAMSYVETDLAEITAEKVGLVAELRRRHTLPDYENHHLVAANALDPADLHVAVHSFRRNLPFRQIAVVNEGLFQYLSAGEMETVARNVRALLVEFGGVWITPDFSIKADVRNVSERQQRFRAIVATATDRPMYNNAFDNDAQLDAFLARLGLRGHVVSQLDTAAEIISIGALQLPRESLERSRSALNLWILSPVNAL